MAKTVKVASAIGVKTAINIFPISHPSHLNLGRESLQIRGVKVLEGDQRCMKR
jgi:hypothetical protein